MDTPTLDSTGVATDDPTAWPLRVGLLTSAGTVAAACFLLIKLEAALHSDDSYITVSIGIGGWLLLATGVLAAVAGVLTLIRQRTLQLG